MNKFSIGEAIQYGWSITKENLGLLIGSLFISGAVGFIPQLFAPHGNGDSSFSPLFPIITLFAYVLQMIISIGLIKIAFLLHDRKPASFNDLFSGYKLVIPYLLTSLLSGVVVFFGLLAFVIPGIILAIAIQFATYIVVDKGMGPMDAIKRSMAITKGSRWNLFLFGLAMVGINFLGVLCFVIGVLISAPVSMIALVHVYRLLDGSSKPTETMPQVTVPQTPQTT